MTDSLRHLPGGGIEYVHRQRVRYRECDPMGVVYHGHYVDYLEYARTEALRAAGLPYKAIEAAGIIMPVTEVHLRYHRSALYDDLLEITVRFPEPPAVRVRAEYEVRRSGEPALLTSGHVILCFVDRERGRPVPAPSAVRAAFEPTAA